MQLLNNLFLHSTRYLKVSKGQLISKANCQAEDSSKKRTNKFVFTSMRRVFIRFFGRILGQKKTFRDYQTLIATVNICYIWIFYVNFPLVRYQIYFWLHCEEVREENASN